MNERPRGGETHRTLYALREAERLLVPEHLDLPDHVLLLDEDERDAAIAAVEAGHPPPFDLRARVAERKAERLAAEPARPPDAVAPAPAGPKTIGPLGEAPPAPPPAVPAAGPKTIGPSAAPEEVDREREEVARGEEGSAAATGPAWPVGAVVVVVVALVVALVLAVAAAAS